MGGDLEQAPRRGVVRAQARDCAWCCSLGGGGCGAVGNVIWGTLIKTRVPDELLGRVASLDWLISIGLVPATDQGSTVCILLTSSVSRIGQGREVRPTE